MFRRRRPADGPIARRDLAELPPRWRAPVEEALESRSRFGRLVDGVPEGPLRSRLERLGTRIDEAVVGCYRTAVRAHTAETTLASLDPERLTAELKAARRRADEARQQGSDTARLDEKVQALATQHASVSRVWNGLEEATEQLRVLDLRLDAAVAQAAELALQPGSGDLADLDRTIDGVVHELDAVRSAFDQLEA